MARRLLENPRVMAEKNPHEKGKRPAKKGTANGICTCGLPSPRVAGVVAMLLEHGTDGNLGNTVNGATPMFFAALKGHFEVCRLLVEHSVDVNKADRGGLTCRSTLSRPGSRKSLFAEDTAWPPPLPDGAGSASIVPERMVTW